MDRTIKLKLDVSEKDKTSLKNTVVVFNNVFNMVAEYGFANHIHSKVSIHHATYKDIREQYPQLPHLFRVQGMSHVKHSRVLRINGFL
jgi:predicted transposase